IPNSWPRYSSPSRISSQRARGRGAHRKGNSVADRPDWDEYFSMLARAVSVRADCRRARHGAVIVKDHRIVATGYNGSPAGGPWCLAGECPRGLQAQSSPDYSNCIALHAEQNAIAYANHADTEGATIYITRKPCDMCMKLIVAAGIVDVVYPT